MSIERSLIASTTFEIQGRRIREYKGMVRGVIVRAHYDASDVGGDRSAATEVLRYGTAVVLE